MKLPLSCIAAFAFAAPALAQAPERVFPKVFMWQGKCYPSDCSTGSTVCFTSGPHFVPFMSVDVSQPGFNPEVAAINVANVIQANLPTPIGSDPMIQVFLKNFGHDYCCSEPDPACSYCGTTPPDQQLRFFTEDDRLPLSPIWPVDYPGSQEWLHEREWRHPFIQNATLSGGLKAWMQEFMLYFDSEVREVPRGLPDPDEYAYRFYSDTEAYIYTNTRNGTYLLRWLAEYNDGSIWNHWPVPGSEGWDPPTEWPAWNSSTGPADGDGKTLAEL